MNGIEVFANGEFSLRVIEIEDSFIVDATDLAHDLGMRDAYRLVESLPEKDKVKGYTLSCTPYDQDVWFVREAGLYRAIGQRQPARIKNVGIREKVVRFQDWVYGEVLPALRKHGRYELTPVTVPVPPPAPAGQFEPDAYTWKETCTVIRQAYEVRTHPAKLRRTLMAAGVLTQTFEPKADFAHCFWWTGTAYLVLRHCVPALFFHYQATERKLALAMGQPAEAVAAAGPIQAELFSQTNS